MSARYRRLTPTEWLYVAAAREFPPFAIQLWIEGEGLALAELRAAVERAAAANPGARLRARGRWWLLEGVGPAVREIAGPLSADHSALREAFDLARAVPCDVLLFRGHGVLFRCSHALMDARGLIFFAEETFRALRGESLLGSARLTTDWERLRASGRTRPWPRARSASPVGAPGSGDGFEWQTRRLDARAGWLSRLQSAVARATLARSPRAAVELLVPVSLRDDDESRHTTTNLASPLLLDFSDGPDAATALERGIAALARGDERALPVFAGVLQWLPASLLARWQARAHRRCVRRDRHVFSAVVSHVGRVSLAGFAAPGFVARAARMMPFDAPGAALTLVTLEHEHGVELAASAPRATARDGALTRALDALLAEPASLRPGLVALFDTQVARTPGADAARDSTRDWNYAQLAARSRDWAARLHAAGVRRGDRVALLAARSADVIAAVLGIARLGAAFVPVDPAWPAERMRFVLADSAPACVVTDADDAGAAQGFATLACGFDAEPSAAPPAIAPRDDDPAYLMYTSGSTGRPKAVVVGHGSLSNYLHWAASNYVDTAAAPVFPLFTSLAFDLTLTSLFVPLITGGAVRVVAEHEPLLAARAIVGDRSLTAIKLTPSHLRLLCEVGLGASPLRTFIVGGEPLSTALARRATEQSPGITIHNEYGPTEATVGCVVHRFDPERDRAAEVPIGKPIDGTTIELVDGEMLIAGACVALGYRTACPESARFTSWRGQRAYRSGDRGTRDADGTLHFGGRLDDQVKIRGHRIEPGEIEHALLADAEIADARVIVDRGGDDAQLVAHVVWRGAPDPEGLRDRLAGKLPAALRPARFVAHTELPLTINGKVDRRALGDRASGIRVPIAAASTTESQLRDLLADVMQRPANSLDAHGSLLEQGCDSLSLAILLQRADATDVLGEFVRDPTLRTLAALLDGRNRASTPRLR